MIAKSVWSVIKLLYKQYSNNYLKKTNFNNKNNILNNNIKIKF